MFCGVCKTLKHVPWPGVRASTTSTSTTTEDVHRARPVPYALGKIYSENFSIQDTINGNCGELKSVRNELFFVIWHESSSLSLSDFQFLSIVLSVQSRQTKKPKFCVKSSESHPPKYPLCTLCPLTRLMYALFRLEAEVRSQVLIYPQMFPTQFLIKIWRSETCDSPECVRSHIVRCIVLSAPLITKHRFMCCKINVKFPWSGFQRVQCATQARNSTSRLHKIACFVAMSFCVDFMKGVQGYRMPDVLWRAQVSGRRITYCSLA